MPIFFKKQECIEDDEYSMDEARERWEREKAAILSGKAPNNKGF